jgi:hypothetical protein
MADENKHLCEGSIPQSGYGPAINYCAEEPYGSLWVGNDEYSSQVNFCPYCGYKAKIQIQPGEPI